MLDIFVIVWVTLLVLPLVVLAVGFVIYTVQYIQSSKKKIRGEQYYD